MPKLTEKQTEFVRHYLAGDRKHGAQVRAAKLAGYGTPTSSAQSWSVIASRLMRNPDIEAAISNRRLDEKDVACAVCTKLFPYKGNKKYCSAECYGTVNVRKQMTELRPCKVCLNDFAPLSCRGLYCCRECRLEASSIRAHGYHRRKYVRKADGLEYSSQAWVRKAKAAIKALEDLGIEI